MDLEDAGREGMRFKMGFRKWGGAVWNWRPGYGRRGGGKAANNNNEDDNDNNN